MRIGKMKFFAAISKKASANPYRMMNKNRIYIFVEYSLRIPCQKTKANMIKPMIP